LVARKAWLFVNRTEAIDTESQESHAEYSWVLRVLGPVWHFGVLLPMAVIGAWALWSQRRHLWLLYALTIAYAATVVLFFVVARYRLPVVPLLAVFASRGVLATVDALPGTGRSISLWGWLSAASIAIVANWPLASAPSQQAITENNLGTALQEHGRYDEAIERYQRALSLQPDYVPAMNNLGTALRAAGRAAEAVDVYDKALATDADRATIHVNRGNALMTQGRIVEAIASFRQAVAADPRSAHATAALIGALYDQGTAAIEAAAFDRATVALREAIALRPDYAEAHNNLGIALASQGKLAEAITEWETALRLAPGFADARRNLELARRPR
jgi:Flp pilus assembly protein TadD